MQESTFSVTVKQYEQLGAIGLSSEEHFTRRVMQEQCCHHCMSRAFIEDGSYFCYTNNLELQIAENCLSLPSESVEQNRDESVSRQLLSDLHARHAKRENL